MRKNLTTQKILFLVLFISAIILSGCFNSKAKPTDQGNATQAKEEQIAQLEKAYESAVVEILKPYFAEKKFDNIKSQLLELKVPAKYLDLHFNLVIAFEQIEQGQKTSDQAKIEDAIEKIEKIKEQYPWIIK